MLMILGHFKIKFRKKLLNVSLFKIGLKDMYDIGVRTNDIGKEM